MTSINQRSYLKMYIPRSGIFCHKNANQLFDSAVLEIKRKKDLALQMAASIKNDLTQNDDEKIRSINNIAVRVQKRINRGILTEKIIQKYKKEITEFINKEKYSEKKVNDLLKLIIVLAKHCTYYDQVINWLNFTSKTKSLKLFINGIQFNPIQENINLDDCFFYGSQVSKLFGDSKPKAKPMLLFPNSVSFVSKENLEKIENKIAQNLILHSSETRIIPVTKNVSIEQTKFCLNKPYRSKFLLVVEALILYPNTNFYLPKFNFFEETQKSLDLNKNEIEIMIYIARRKKQRRDICNQEIQEFLNHIENKMNKKKFWKYENEKGVEETLFETLLREYVKPSPNCQTFETSFYTRFGGLESYYNILNLDA